MGIISGILKYKAFKKGVEVVKDAFSSKGKTVRRSSSAKRRPALRKATARG